MKKLLNKDNKDNIQDGSKTLLYINSFIKRRKKKRLDKIMG